jgi:endonuclease G
MKISSLLLIAALAFTPNAVFSQTGGQAEPLPITSCAAFKQPVGKTLPLICRTAYLVGYDPAAKIPGWVSYTLAPEHVIGCVKRSNAFESDQSLPEGNRATPADYAHGGYDIGHNAPDGDMDWDVAVERQSFILTNMTPQLAGLNRGIWKVLETNVRAWAYERGHTLAIYTGPIYDITTDKKLSKDQIDIPHAYFKIIVDTQTGENLSFVFQQSGNQGKYIPPFQTNVAAVEKLTGLTFPVAGDKTIQSTIWAADFSVLDKAKKAACHK